jgi:hypothetical protein
LVHAGDLLLASAPVHESRVIGNDVGLVDVACAFGSHIPVRIGQATLSFANQGPLVSSAQPLSLVSAQFSGFVPIDSEERLLSPTVRLLVHIDAELLVETGTDTAARWKILRAAIHLLVDEALAGLSQTRAEVAVDVGHTEWTAPTLVGDDRGRFGRGHILQRHAHERSVVQLLFQRL